MRGLDESQKRHLQIIELRDLGLNQRQIAAQLGISHTTVCWHINRERAIEARKAGMDGQGEPYDDTGSAVTSGRLSFSHNRTVDHDPLGHPKQGLSQ